MTNGFAVGDHVGWESEVGRVSGTITKVYVKAIDFKGYAHHASSGDAHCEIQGDMPEQAARHTSSALRDARRIQRSGAV